MDIKKETIERMKNAKRGFALTGAGISAPSGIPTFRGKDGLWKDKDPRKLASQSGFRSDPDNVWQWYNERREMIKEKEPNRAHYSLTEIQKMIDNFAVITQNVDNLHQEAGTDNVIELHGNIFKNKCNNCGKSHGELKSDNPVECDKCGGLIRPDVVWFGEPLPEDELNKAWEYAKNSDIVFVIGTSAMVQPAASLPIISIEHGGYVVEINAERTVISEYVNDGYYGDVAEVLPELVESVS